eukprot:gene8460-10391_t
MKPMFEIKSRQFGDYVIQGCVYNYQLQIMNEGGVQVGSVQKKKMPWTHSETNELEIADNCDDAFFTAVMFAINDYFNSY